ncbi:MAG TPA: hypothetical protein VKR30_05415 [Candidatus Limnocylindrales bacterium]|nr:hypothetical protein [Candidatus Limnocylindrales bacterium]
MPKGVGQLVLALSGAGFPLTQLAIRRLGRSGAIVVEGVAVLLLTRDAAMIAGGTPSRLGRGPAILLWLETAVAAAATLFGLRLVFDATARRHAAESRPTRFEAVRRAAVGGLFGLHTLRFRIYLSPDHGRRSAA